MHFGHVVAPGDEDVGIIDVFIASHGLIESETGHEPGYRACHTESGICFDIIGTQTAFEELGGNIAVWYGPLSRAVDGHGIFAVCGDGFLNFLRDEIKGLMHGNFDHLTISAYFGRGQPVFAIEGLNGMVSLHTAQPFIDAAVRVTLYGYGSAVGNTYQNPAPCTAETAWRLFPGKNSGRSLLPGPVGKGDSRKE